LSLVVLVGEFRVVPLGDNAIKKSGCPWLFWFETPVLSWLKRKAADSHRPPSFSIILFKLT
jgi:hypothetical protein